LNAPGSVYIGGGDGDERPRRGRLRGRGLVSAMAAEPAEVRRRSTGWAISRRPGRGRPSGARPSGSRRRLVSPRSPSGVCYSQAKPRGRCMVRAAATDDPGRFMCRGVSNWFSRASEQAGPRRPMKQPGVSIDAVGQRPSPRTSRRELGWYRRAARSARPESSHAQPAYTTKNTGDGTMTWARR